MCTTGIMARKLRLRMAGLSQHVIQRGNNRSDIFTCSEDHEAFLLSVAYALSRHPAHLHGYVLMKTHVHLLVTPLTPEAVEKMMQSIGLRYVQYFNRRYARTGALFEGRYRATTIDTEHYWFRCLRYVELNPVRAGLVSRPGAYPWSSHACNGFGVPDGLITPHPLYEELGDDPGERQRRWRAITATEDSDGDLADLRAALHRGGKIGDVIGPPAEWGAEAG